MLDDVFTYSGALFGLAASGTWLWLALRVFPGLDALASRHEDDLRLGAAASRPGPANDSGTLGRLAVGLTTIALIFTVVGYAIPD